MTKMVSIFFLFFTSATLAQHSSPSKELSKLVSQSKIASKNLGISVLEIVDGKAKSLFDLNQKKQMIPASLSKIPTALAALETFGPGHKFKTQILSAGKINKSKLVGDICLKGGGDASFVSETLWFLVNEFSRTRVKTITGNIIVDDTHFDSTRFDESREDHRVDRAYDSPIGAMTFNWSAVNVFVRPSQIGSKPHVLADPEGSFIKVTNKAKTVRGKSRSIKVTRKALNNISGKGFVDEIIVSGTIGSQVNEIVKYKSISKPALWSGYNLKSFLNQRGIALNGKVQLGKCDTKTVLAEAEGKPIELIVRDMMKFSNNYVAEILTKNMGAKIFGSPGTMSKGIKVISRHIQKQGVSALNILNPSGLSRENQATSLGLTQLMMNSYKNFKTFPEFLTSNAIGGVDGTLKSRKYSSKNEGRVRAKTGRLSGVVGLSGVIGGQSGRQYFFTFIFNGKTAKMNRSIQLFDTLANKLAEK